MNRRRGFTMLEMTVALVGAAFLVAGLAAAMAVSAAAMNDAASTQAQNVDAALAMDRAAADLRHATTFTERTAAAATFTVPDRNGDSQPETIRYAWSGTPGDAVTMAYNGGSPAVLAPNVQQFDLSWMTRSMTGTGFAKGYLGPSYDGFTESKWSSSLFTTTSIAIDTPPGTSPGDLLIAAVAIRNDAGTFSVPAGWNGISTQSFSQVSLGIFWRTAAAGEPASHTLTWATDRNNVYAWMMRFAGQHPTAPIDVSAATAQSQSNAPTAPAVTSTVDNALVLRIAAITGANITIDNPGLAGHEAITMDQAGNVISGGAGYLLQGTAGSTGTAGFSVSAVSYWIAATIVIAPTP